MKIDVLRRKLDTLRREVEAREAPDMSCAPDPVEWAERTTGMILDDWQAEIMRGDAKRELLLCSRQTGKTQVVALRCAYDAIFRPGASIIAIAPTLRQSRNLFDRIENTILNSDPVPKILHHTRTMIRLAHGGTVRALPGDSPDKVRGLTATGAIVDEAAFVRDEVMAIILPMLSTTDGTLVMLSTPSGPSGTFYDNWQAPKGWKKTKVLATQCSRISPEFLEEARAKLGDLSFRQEYMCEFVQSATTFFSASMIADAFDHDDAADSYIDDVEESFIL